MYFMYADKDGRRYKNYPIVVRDKESAPGFCEVFMMMMNGGRPRWHQIDPDEFIRLFDDQDMYMVAEFENAFEMISSPHFDSMEDLYKNALIKELV